MYDWIIIVMSNNRVPPDPSRYLSISHLSCLQVLERRSETQGDGWESGDSRDHK
jgi:hypothetical protein